MDTVELIILWVYGAIFVVTLILVLFKIKERHKDKEEDKYKDIKK